MISFLFFMFLTQSFAREFPDKEVRRRCDLQKVQACVAENQQIINSIINEQNSVISRQNQERTVLDETQKTIAPIDDGLATIRKSQAAIDEILAEKIVEKSKYDPIFSQGPSLLETKFGQSFQLPLETPDYNGLRLVFEGDKINLEKNHQILADEQLYLANRIKQLQSEIDNLAQTISQFEGQKMKHGRMCEFGCKEKYCPEN